ncbi:MAG TPA: DHH family phosphoesterase [Thermoplasmata archaeon]|nr:DHH family phosphoesterase [Thermoplasmata archaeon]
MFNRAKQLAAQIIRATDVHIVTHIDADGVAAGAIAASALRRMGKEYSVQFIKQLDEFVIQDLLDKNPELVWFTDLGSNNEVSKLNHIVTDHHHCTPENCTPSTLNPHLFGLDGSIEISGAGATYLVAKTVDENNIDLASLAVVGACGDLQDRKHCRLMGVNRSLLEDGGKAKTISWQIDVQYFGRETRPVYKLLQYATDPLIPGVTGREEASISLLIDLEIPLKDGDNWRRWIDLTKDEKRRILSTITKMLLQKGFSSVLARRLIGEVYVLTQEEEGTELHDAKEYATLLNATARYGNPEFGLKVCMGDREVALREARSLLKTHRHNLLEGIQFAKEEGVVKRKYFQYFHAGEGIRDTIVGIITGMLLNEEETTADLPMIGFAATDDGRIKVSARGTKRLVNKGLNLSVALRKAAEKVGGIGGGHDIAAGATIPKGNENEFLEILEKELETQLS